MHHLLKTAANMIPRLQKWFQWEFWVHRWAAINSRIIIVGCVGCRRDCCYDVFVLLVENDEWWVMSDECDEVNQHVWWIALDFILIPSSTDLHFVTRFTPPVIPRFAPHSITMVNFKSDFYNFLTCDTNDVAIFWPLKFPKRSECTLQDTTSPASPVASIIATKTQQHLLNVNTSTNRRERISLFSTMRTL